MPIRWRWPPENSCGIAVVRARGRGRRRRAAPGPAGGARRVARAVDRSGSAMIEPTRLRGFSDAYGSWKTICISRRSGRSSRALSRAIDRPSKRTSPEVGSSSRTIVRPSVDLPQPDSPTSPSVSPSRTEKVTPSTAWTAADLPPEQALPDREVRREVLDLDERRRRRRSRRGRLPADRPRRAARACSPGSSQQRSRWAGPPPRASSAGSVVHRSKACGQRGRKRQPAGGSISDGGIPAIECRRSCFGRSRRGIEPSRPHVYGCCGS